MEDWRMLNQYVYVDISSIIQKSSSVYEYWTKTFIKNNPEYKNLEQKYNRKIKHILTRGYININSKEVALSAMFIYDESGKYIIDKQETPINCLEWFDFPPGSTASVLYNIILGNYMPPKFVTCPIAVSVTLSIIFGLVMTFILGGINNPLIPSVIFAYTIHPLFKYVLSFKNMHIFGHSLIRRFIIAWIIGAIMMNIQSLGNKILLKNAYYNATEYCKYSNSHANWNECIKNHIYKNDSSNYNNYINIWNYCYSNNSLTQEQKDDCVYTSIVN